MNCCFLYNYWSTVIKVTSSKCVFICSFIMITCLLLICCNGSTPSYQIADYNKKTEDLKVDYGKLQFDTLPKNLKTHNITKGDKFVIEYSRSGTTVTGVDDYESKYTETLLFQIDTVPQKFKYCNMSLNNINCKYYWTCLASEIKKEMINVKKGCITGEVFDDSLILEIDIDPEFGFGGIFEKNDNRIIKYKTRLPTHLNSPRL